jgi:hypothetical protein
VKEHIGPQLEGVGEAVSRDAPGFRKVADDLRIISRVELEQRRVMRRNRMQKPEGDVAVTIVIARLRNDGEFEGAASFGNGLGKRCVIASRHQCGSDRGQSDRRSTPSPR